VRWLLAVLFAASCRTPPLEPVADLGTAIDAAAPIDAAASCPLAEPKPHSVCSAAGLHCLYSHEQSCDQLDCTDGVWLEESDHCIPPP
jgi:hypothetical protein